MALKFLCAHCNKEIVTRTLRAGEQATCRSCGGQSLVPQNSLNVTDEEYYAWMRGAHVATGQPAAQSSYSSERKVDYLKQAPHIDPSIIGDVNAKSVFDYFEDGWRSVRPHFLVAILGPIVVYFLLATISLLSEITFFFDIVTIFIQPLAVGGLTYLYLNIARNSDPRFEDITDGRKRYVKLLVIHLINMAISLVVIIPLVLMTFGFAGASAIISGEFTGYSIGALIAGGMMIIIGLMLVSTLLTFTYPAAMDFPELDALDSFKRSYQLVSRHFLKVLLFFIVAYVFNIIAFFFCILPIFLSMPMTAAAFMRFYLDLKAEHERTAVA